MAFLRMMFLAVVVAALVGCGGSEKGREPPRTQTTPERKGTDLRCLRAARGGG
jgi:hypothetical protein